MRTSPSRAHFTAFLLTLCLCGLAAGGQENEKAVLHVYTWLDYFDSNVINDFQIKHNCEVVIDYYDSNDLMLKALELDSGGFDVMTPSSVVSRVMDRRGMLLRLDHSKLPNLRHIDKSSHALVADPEMRFSAPYTATVTGIGFNRKRVPEADRGSWNIFSNPAYRGRAALLDETREIMGAALKLTGRPINSADATELRQAGLVAREWLKSAVLEDINDICAGLEGGEYLIGQGYSGDMAYLISRSPDIGFYVPGEGSSLAADVFVIPGDSPMADLAHAFINHMLDPEMAKVNMESTFYYMPNATALEMVDPALLDNPAFNVPGLVNAKCEKLLDLGESEAVFDEVWKGVVTQK